MTLDDHVQNTQRTVVAAFAISKKETRDQIANDIARDIIYKTLTLVKDYPDWPDIAFHRAMTIHRPMAWTKPAGRHSPPLPETTPPAENTEKVTHPQQGTGENL